MDPIEHISTSQSSKGAVSFSLTTFSGSELLCKRRSHTWEEFKCCTPGLTCAEQSCGMVRTWSCPKMGIHNVSGGLQGGPVHKLGARGGAGWRLLMWVVLPRVSSWVPKRNGETLLVSRMRYAEPLSSRNLWGAVHQGGLAGCRVEHTHLCLRKSGCRLKQRASHLRRPYPSIGTI